MSPQESGPWEPKQERPGDGSDDGGTASAGGGASPPHPGPPGGETPWAAPAGPETNPWDQSRPGQQAPAWNQRPAWEQPSPPWPHWHEQHPNPNNGYPGAGSPYNGSSYRGFPYPPAPYGASPFSAVPYGASPFGQARYTAPPKPGIIPLRPLMFGEILDGSFQAIRRNAKAMLGAGLLAQSLSAILAAVLTGVLATSSGSIEAWAQTASTADIASLGIGMMAGFGLLSILSVFITAVLQGAMVVPVARSVLNRPTGFRRMLSLARPRIGALVRLAALLVAAAVAAIALFIALIVVLFSNVRGAGVLLVVPLMLGFFAVFVWVAIKLMVAPAAVVIEELGAAAGLRRSWDLTRANWWRILGITLVVAVLVAVLTQVILIPAGLLPSVLSSVVSPHGGSGQDRGLAVAAGITSAVVGALVGAVGYAFQTSVMALLYMDLRMRKDGLDIALLHQLETGADPDGIPGRGAGNHVRHPGPGTAPGAWPYGS